MTWFLTAVRHEDNNLESSVVVQELEFAINRALYGVLWSLDNQYIVGSLSWHSLTHTENFRAKWLQWPFTISLGCGKGYFRFWNRSDQNCGYLGKRKYPLTYNRENGVSAFSQSPLIGSLSNLQVTRTGIKSRMSLNLGRVGRFTTELFALERSNWLWMGKMVSPSFLSYYEFSLHQTYR